MTYPETLDFLQEVRSLGLRKSGTEFGLENIQALANKLGNPERKLKFIHIAGTNGKGSTSVFCASCLQEAGYKVGLYTSPHLIQIGERIQVNRVIMSADEMAEGITLLKDFICEIEEVPGSHPTTFFEVMTVLALWQFSRKQVDWVVWETGLGGRLDATNIVTPKISIITNIDFDHQAYLGTTLPQIASEKAGIIKPQVPIVTSTKDPAALEVIKKVAQGKKSPLIVIRNEKNGNEPLIEQGKQHAFLNGKKMQLGLLGRHQVENAACAIAAIKNLEERQLCEIDNNAMERGLAKARWQGRFQILQKDPPWVVDGAHNPAGAITVMETWRSFYDGLHYNLVCGFVQNKDFAQMLSLFLSQASQVTIVGLASDRSARPEEIVPLCGNTPVEIFPDLLSAWPTIQEQAALAPTLITGSLFLVGEVLALHQGRKHQLDFNERMQIPVLKN